MSNEEERRFAVEILTELVPVLSVEKLAYTALQFGIPIAEFYGPTEADMFNEQTRLAA